MKKIFANIKYYPLNVKSVQLKMSDKREEWFVFVNITKNIDIVVSVMEKVFVNITDQNIDVKNARVVASVTMV